MEELLKVTDLLVHFKNAAPERNAVDGISFEVHRGEILGIVGESGSGKTVTAMALTGLLPQNSAIVRGNILLDGQEMLQCSEKTLQTIRGNRIAVVFQEPMTSMNPTMKIGPQVEEALRAHTKLSRAERKQKALEAMCQVELPDPEAVYDKYPHELSGGMLQRAMIAAAIVAEPDILLADEPTTALDVTIQAQILQLLKRLSEERQMTVLFISHNLHVVRKLCTRVMVMKRGHIVEENTVEEIFAHPQHEYTKQLLEAIPTREHRLV